MPGLGMPKAKTYSEFMDRATAISNDMSKSAAYDAVVLGWTRPSEVNGMFMDSIVGMMVHDVELSSGLGRGHNIIRPGGGTISLKSGPRIAEARSQLVDQFLTDPAYAGTPWLLMLDTDMNLPRDLVPRMLAHAHKEKVPILGALCFAGTPYGRQYPTVYRAYNEDDGHMAVEPVEELPEGDLVKVGATGAACLLVHRWVYLAMAKQFATLANGRPNPYPWFVEGLTTSKGIPLGEDIAFCRKAMTMGIPIHVALDVPIGHMKEGELTVETFEQYRKAVDETEVAE